MLGNNNEFYQNSLINIRKDNDEWKNAAGTCSANLIEKSVTENGEYYAKDDNADGYSSVKVEVPSAPVPETFEVIVTLEIVDQQTFTFLSSKTLQETISAYNDGKTLSFTVQIIEGGVTTTTTNVNYLYWDGVNSFLLTFLTNTTASGMNYCLGWSGDSGSVEPSSMIMFIAH